MDDQVYNNASVLVTGGCGFIGSHLVESLVHSGSRVTVLDNMQAGKLENLSFVKDNVYVINGDIRDINVVQRVVNESQPQYVFHLAANASVPGSVADPTYDFETNCAGTFVLLNSLRELNCCKSIVVASSGAVYGEPDTFPISETHKLQPISPYGASKLSSEIEGQMFHAVYGIPVSIARIFNCYGPRMARFVILDFLHKLQKNPYVMEILGTGQQVRDFTFVSDTITGLRLIAVRGQAGMAYNVSTGRSLSVTNLAHTLLSILGLEGKTEIKYSGKSWIGDAQCWEVSIEKIRAIGYEPNVTLEEGLLQTITWFSAAHGPVSKSDNQ